MTQIKIGNQISELSCLNSKVDKYACYEVTNGNIDFEYIDLVCDSQHFARFSVEKTGSDGDITLKVGQEQKVLSIFVDNYRATVLSFRSLDQEQFWQFIGFVSIKHAYGAATAIRVLIEDFLKLNYLSPGIIKYLGKRNLKKLYMKVEKDKTDLASEAVMMITVKNLFLTLMGIDPKSNGLRGHINDTLKKFYRSRATKNRRFKKEQWEKLKLVYDTSSKIIHGQQYDAYQLFNEVNGIFEIFKEYSEKEGKWTQ
ncbi:MAG: hypothetical protein M0Z77_09120 [Thermoplasmatales archaeon]|nr:hypothetical protein [Thermoplasmatales archaeon]